MKKLVPFTLLLLSMGVTSCKQKYQQGFQDGAESRDGDVVAAYNDGYQDGSDDAWEAAEQFFASADYQTGYNDGVASQQGAINNAYDTLKTLHSGANAPSSPSAYMLWFETDTSLLKIYDGSDWVTIGELDATNNSFHTVVGDWKIKKSTNDLVFEYSGTPKMKLTSAGALTCVGDITAFGTI